jgi:hypothetical protein
MENNFQQEIISEILKNKRIINIVNLRKFTTFCEFTVNEASFDEIQTDFSIYDVPMAEQGDTKLIEAYDDANFQEDIRCLVAEGITSVFDIELRNDNLRWQYEEIIGEVCPV